MARPGGNPLCVGKKGKSGRKTIRVERAKEQALQNAWHKVVTELNKEDVSVKDIALPLVLKDMVTKQSVDGKIDLKQVLVKFLDDKSTEDNRD